MAHRLELAVKKSVDTVNSVTHFRYFVDELYKVYSLSAKNQREIDSIAEALSVELLKVQKVFDVRWLFSSFVSVKALLRNYSALYTHFEQCSAAESDRPSKEKAKYKGLARKLNSWFFAAEVCMMKDALRCLKQLSLYLQSANANVISVGNHVDDVLLKLLAFKTEHGKSLLKLFSSFNSRGEFKGIKLEKSYDDCQKFNALRAQFFKCLHDNIKQRFPTDEFLFAASCLDKSLWPKDPLQKALFGEKEIARLCKEFNFSSKACADVVLEFAMFKKTNGSIVGKQLKYFMNLLLVQPISSADCERGFSQMNLHHTDYRNRLLTKTVNDLLMISITTYSHVGCT